MQEIEFEMTRTPEGHPSGGSAYGIGINVVFQAGPIENGKQNGATIEDLLAVVARRLEEFQSSTFKCPENDAALAHVSLALSALESRTKDRVRRGVEGTYQR